MNKIKNKQRLTKTLVEVSSLHGKVEVLVRTVVIFTVINKVISTVISHIHYGCGGYSRNTMLQDSCQVSDVRSFVQSLRKSLIYIRAEVHLE